MFWDDAFREDATTTTACREACVRTRQLKKASAHKRDPKNISSSI